MIFKQFINKMLPDCDYAVAGMEKTRVTFFVMNCKSL